MTKRTRNKEENVRQVTIARPKRASVTITVIGDTPYVGTNFAEDTRKELANTQSGKNKMKARAPRNIEGEANGRRHIVNGVDCIPAEAFRAAMIDTAKDDTLPGVNGEAVRRSIIVQGDQGNFITILHGKEPHEEPEIFPSVVKLANGMRHVAYRPMYKHWSATFTIIYLVSRFTEQDVISLLYRAGITTGVGDTRRIGGGRFYVAGEQQV